MRRYLRLYLNFLRFSFSRATTFRLDFWFRFFMDIFYYFVAISFFKLLYLQSASIGGWNSDQAMVFIGACFVVDAINMTFVANNFWYLPLLINSGELDYYLVRPVASWFFLCLREIAVSSFINLIGAIGILSWGLHGIWDQLSFVRLILFFVLILNGALLYALIRFVILVPVFWTQSSRGADGLFWKLVLLMERPDRIFTGLFRVLVLTVIPFGLLASVPTRVLLEEPILRPMLLAFGVTAIFLVGAVFLWKSGLRAYSSASS